jgi:hypothetical protein
MICLHKYTKEIEVLNPLQDSVFEYNTSAWSKLLPEYKEIVSDYENKPIKRADIINAYAEYNTGNKNKAVRAFLLTMIWGFADNGYGTYRTNKYLSNPDNIDLIIKSFDYLRSDNLESAFKKLNNISGLGISYISKILYFATFAFKYDKYALIYDIRVATSLVKLTIPNDLFEIISIYPSSNFKNYHKYNTLIHNLAEKYNLKADSIEMFLFNQKF